MKGSADQRSPLGARASSAIGSVPRMPRTPAIERQLPYRDNRDSLLRKTAVRSDDPESHRQIKSGAFLLNIRRGEVDR